MEKLEKSRLSLPYFFNIPPSARYSGLTRLSETFILTGVDVYSILIQSTFSTSICITKSRIKLAKMVKYLY